jgi:hypothetical protein
MRAGTVPFMSNLRLLRRLRRVLIGALCGAVLLSLDGCGVAALPCRVTSAVLDVVPVVGHAAATPFDACASAID